MTDYARELEFALEAARAGARIAEGHFGRGPSAKQKSDGTWVTEADWATEAQIRLRIARAFPDHNVLGEEEGLTAAGGGPAVEGAPTWIVDPIDGTNNYMAGIPIWATLLGLRIHDEVVVGVCHAPALGETYDAATGTGARMNGSSIGVSEVERLEDALVVTSGDKRFLETGHEDLLNTLVSRSGRTRGFGDFWGHMLVARGAAGVMVEPELSVWDVAALQPIVAEAGGLLTHLDGSPWRDKGSCLTAAPALHAAVVDIAASL